MIDKECRVQKFSQPGVKKSRKNRMSNYLTNNTREFDSVLKYTSLRVTSNYIFFALSYLMTFQKAFLMAINKIAFLFVVVKEISDYCRIRNMC